MSKYKKIVIVKSDLNIYLNLFVVTIFILLGTYNSVFSYLALLFAIIQLLITPITTNAYILFYIMNFSSIFKASPDSFSFFTLLFIVFVIKYMVKKKISTFEVNLLLFMIFLIIMQYIHSGTIDILKTIKFFVSMEFIFYIWDDRKKLNVYILMKVYSLGVIIASLIAFGANPNLFKINEYILKQNFKYGNVFIGRFSGLYSDPNYYGVNVIIAMCLLIILYYSNRLKLSLFLTEFFALMFFAINTYSKSVFFMLLIPLSLIFYILFKKRHYFLSITLLAIGFILLGFIFRGEITKVNMIIYRLKGTRLSNLKDNLNYITTGRIDLWETYLDRILHEYKYLYFGRGINYPIIGDLAEHNTFIQLVYYFGIIGTVWFFFMLLSLKGRYQASRNYLNYSVLFTVLLMYCFLSELFYFDAPFHLALCLLTIDINLNPQKSNESLDDNVWLKKYY